MFFDVLSRWTIEDVDWDIQSDKVAIVSIHDVNMPNARLKVGRSIQDILFLGFDDVGGNFTIGSKVMSALQAEQIAKFALKWKDKVDGIIVNCEAGISRSSGVAAALMKYFTGDDSLIFNSSRFCPNMTCYRLVLEALMKEGEHLIDT